jgi:AcrR family transcriptional regulator
MDGVAAEVGVTKPLLYAYWGNKERIYLACLGTRRRALLETVGHAVGSAPDPAEATELGPALASSTSCPARRGAFRVLFDETLPTGGESRPRVHEHREQIVALVATTLLAELTPRARGEGTRGGRGAVPPP